MSMCARAPLCHVCARVCAHLCWHKAASVDRALPLKAARASGQRLAAVLTTGPAHTPDVCAPVPSPARRGLALWEKPEETNPVLHLVGNVGLSRPSRAALDVLTGQHPRSCVCSVPTHRGS